MTNGARENFLALAPKYPRGDQWSEEDLRAACELDGICCYDNLEDAVSWAESQDYDVPLVEFEGEIVSEVYEANGYLATVLREIRAQLVSGWREELSQSS